MTLYFIQGIIPLNGGIMYKDRIADIDKLKQELDKFRPLDESILQQLKQYYKISLTYTSNAIEGNSLTETETKVVLEDGITIGGKPLKDHFEAIGHSEAYDFLYKLSQAKEITEENILNLHKLFYRHITPDNAGTYRDKNVIITGSDFVPPSYKKVPDFMHDFANKIPDLRAKFHPVEFAALLHKELVTIHPFIDGNGRTARLLMNLALLQDGYAITIIPPILRNDYIYTLKQAQIDPKDDRPFINFVAEMVYESMKDYIRLIERVSE